MSTEPVRVYSGLTVAQIALNSSTAVKLFDKANTDGSEEDVANYVTLGFRELKNLDAAIAIYIGPDATVTTASGHRIDPGQPFTLAGSGRVFLGEVWAIAASGNPSASTFQY